MAKRAKHLFVVTLAFTTVSCTSLPDTSGYTAATVQLRNSAALAGDILSAELKRGIDAIPPDVATPELADASTKFSEAWGKTVTSLDALSRYAGSIEQITAAGKGGEASGRALAGSVIELAGTLGLGPAAAAGSLIVDTAGLVSDAIANMRAARSLRQSLEAADPAVQFMTAAMVKQTGTAEQLFEALITEQRNNLDRQYDGVRNADRELNALALQVANAATSDSATGNEARALRLRLGREANAAALASDRAAVAALDAREREGLALFAATRTALETWGSTHTQLVAAVRERRPVNIQAVLAASDDVRTLITRWRDL